MPDLEDVLGKEEEDFPEASHCIMACGPPCSPHVVPSTWCRRQDAIQADNIDDLRSNGRSKVDMDEVRRWHQGFVRSMCPQTG